MDENSLERCLEMFLVKVTAMAKERGNHAIGNIYIIGFFFLRVLYVFYRFYFKSPLRFLPLGGLGLPLGRTSPKPSTVKPLAHLLLQLHRLPLRLLLLGQLNLRPQAVLRHNGVNLYLGLVAPARTPSARRRKQALLEQLLPAVPPQRASAKSRRDLVDGQVQQIHEPAGAAAAHGRALRSGAASDLGKPAAPRRGLVRQEPLPAPSNRLARHDLVWLVNKGSERKIRKWVQEFGRKKWGGISVFWFNGRIGWILKWASEFFSWH